jgi:quinoprotein glucose dehydrogenase
MTAVAGASMLVNGQVTAVKAPTGDWRTYNGRLDGSRYSPLDEITAANFNDLEVAWRFKTDNLGPRPEFNLQSTPLVANGVLYSTGGTRRAVFALDAATGELRWVHGEEEGARAESSPRQLSGRGLSYWTDGVQKRILYVTIGYQLVALDAKTGSRIPTFGRNGIVDLKQDADQTMDLVTGDVGYHAAPIVVGDAIVIGSAHTSGQSPKSYRNEKGLARAFDVRTGKRLWTFRTIPRPGEFGNDTWEGDSWSYTGNTGVWAQISADEDLGIVYLPVETPTGDYYGGHRLGNNLFSESLVAVNAKTGKRLWHYQLVHHGIWDWDIPAAPILANITVSGKAIKAVAQPTKQGWLFVFDRVTGQPVWPIEEQPQPQSDVPGERTSPTQPVPTKPPAYDRQGLAIDDLIDYTPELRAEAATLVSKYKIGPIYTPPVVSRVDGPIATIQRPSAATNWPGASLDPETGIIYAFSSSSPTTLGLVNAPSVSDMRYVRGTATASGVRAAQLPAGPAAAAAAGGAGGEGGGGGLSVQGLSIVKPPYAQISAIDLNKGEILWQIPHGETPDNVRNHPALKGLQIPRTGRAGRIGTLVTKTLVIAGEAGFFTNTAGRRGAMLRAYDKATGKDAGAIFMPAPQSGSPMTYQVNGKQHLVLAISGGNYTGELVAYKLR